MNQTESFAYSNEKNILNDGKPWETIKREIKYSKTVPELMIIYNAHPNLHKHKQFLENLTGRKKQINK